MTKSLFIERDARTLAVRGTDAADFLQRLTTANVKRLAVGNSVPALVLTGTSQVIASFQLCRAAEEFFLIAAAAEFPALAEHFERMHFSETLERRELPTRAWWTFDPVAVAAPESAVAVNRDSSREVTLLAWRPNPGSKLGCAAMVGAADATLSPSADFPPGSRQVDENFWQALRIRARIPVFGSEWETGARALDAGFLAWIDRGKGCYPGQEVVEKSLNVGRPARALVLVGSVDETALASGASRELACEGKTAGRLTSVAREAKGAIGLAVVSWERRAPGTVFASPGNPASWIVCNEE